MSDSIPPSPLVTLLQNYGFTHFIVGRDHSGVSSFYQRYGSQQIFNEIRTLDIKILPFSEPYYCTVCGSIATANNCKHTGMALNGKDVRKLLSEGRQAELTFMLRDDVLQLLSELSERGKTLFCD